MNEENKVTTQDTVDENNPASVTAIWRNFYQGFGKTIGEESLSSSSNAAQGVKRYIFDPYIQNARVKKISGLLGGNDERSEIESAVKNPNDNEDALRQYAQQLNYANYPLYRKNRMPSDILTYHNYTIPLDSQMDEADRKQDEILISSWRECFRPSYQFRRIASQVGIFGKLAYYYRQKLTRSTNYSKDDITCFTKNAQRVEGAFLQQLPVGWWKITGFTDKNLYKVSFNLMYFLQLGNSIEDFDPFFQEAYKALIGADNSILLPCEGLDVLSPKKRKMAEKNLIKIGGKKYKPNADAKIGEGVEFGCANGTWFYWVTLPADKCFVFSDQEATAVAAPSDLGLFLQAKDLEAYSLLQQQLASLPLNSMVVGEIPFHENNLTGNTNDDFRVSPETMIFFNELFNSTAPSGTGVQGLPYKNLKLMQFEGVPNGNEVYMKALQQFLISTGLGSLFTLTDKPNEAQVKTAQILEARYANFIYEQFENFVAMVYRRHLNLTYRWEFHIFGDCFSDENVKTELKTGLSLGQSYLFPRYVAMQDYSTEGAIATMDYLKDAKIYEKFILLPNSYTSSGRPNSTTSAGGDKINDKPKKEEGGSEE